MHTMGIVFSNIYDETLRELTGVRTVASLPFGGRYRQVDFVLSNMSHSGIYQIGLITKYNYRSLMDHLGDCQEWDLNRKNERLTFLPPFVNGQTGVYSGKLEALRSAEQYLNNPRYDMVVLSDSTVLCNIDYRPVIEAHLKSRADITVVTSDKVEKIGGKFPLLVRQDRRGRVTEIEVDAKHKKGQHIGMGMFVMRRDKLLDAVQECCAKGMGHLERDFIQRLFNKGELNVHAYHFGGVVLMNQSTQDYYANTMALLNKEVRDGLFLEERPIYTKVRDEFPSFYGEDSRISECLVADGCILRGNAEKSVLFRGVNIEDGAQVKECVIMQNAHIGKGAKLECVILDKDVIVSPGAELKGTPAHPVIVKKGETV